MKYTDFVSTEPMSIIEANECQYNIGDLATKRFRAAFNLLHGMAEAIKEKCEEDDYCIVCDNHPSSGHSKDCAFWLSVQ